MDDLDKTLPGRRYEASSDADAADVTLPGRRYEAASDAAADDVTLPGKRDRKPDGRFAVGDLIMNRYKVLAELGQGGMGVVYKCFDETAGIEVALKALPPELSHSALEMEDIKENFQLVAKLVHQNIAISKNLELDRSNGNYYLIMECVEGEDLRRWLKRKRKEGPLTPDMVLPIIRQVAAALDYAHKEMIIHRDIKPGNIMINSAGDVKVLDFGLAAQIHTSMTRVSMAFGGTGGTGPYMAPEQWRGQAQGAAADQYALAVMTYEMLAGHLPFESTDPAVLREAVLNEPAGPVSGVPSAVSNALQKALSKEAAGRFSSCSDFADALDGKKIRTVKKSAGKKSLFVLLTVLFFLIFAGAGWYGYRLYQGNQKRLEEDKEKRLEEDKLLLQKQQEIYRLQMNLESKKEYIDALKPDAGQTFGKHLKEFAECYKMGTFAVTGNISLARDYFTRAMKAAEWIEKNLPLREEAGNLQKELARQKAEADRYDGAKLFHAFYQQGENSVKNGKTAYEDGKFEEAIASFKAAAESFGKVVSGAKEQKRQFLLAACQTAEKNRDWQMLQRKAQELQPFDSASAQAYAKTAEIKLLEAQITGQLNQAQAEISAKRWKSAQALLNRILSAAPEHPEAQKLARQVELELKPYLRVVMLVNGKAVTGRCTITPRIESENERGAELKKGTRYQVSMEYNAGDEVWRGAETLTADWEGEKEICADLKIEFRTVNLSGGAVLKLLPVKAGTFTMGSPASEDKRHKGEVQHRVTLTSDYWLGETEVTQAQWRAVMGDNPSKFKGDNLPVEQVSWGEAMAFCRKLNELTAGKRPAGYVYGLPTEAQWEYACRAGTTTAFSYGNASDADMMNHDGNYPCGGGRKGKYLERTTPVKSYRPNAWGFYDMHGNVREWCADWYGNYGGDAEDPAGPSSGSGRVYRGGSWDGGAGGCHSAYRSYDGPGIRNISLGFRVALVPDDIAVKAGAVPSASSSVPAVPKMSAVTLNLPGNAALKLLPVKAGTFTMGDGSDKHQVRLTRDYWLGETEVTQAQWQAVMGNNPSHFKGDNLPVEFVSWEDAMAFCRKLNELTVGKRPAGYVYGLPTEAQWEYACRAGTIGDYNVDGAELKDLGWYGEFFVGKTHPVKKKRPNAWGFYDMHGNVWEWCVDWYGDYGGDTVDPTSPGRGSCRVFRGGGWNSFAGGCRSGYRNNYGPGYRNDTLGIRLALVPGQ